jgi:hypothetical protein
MSIAIRPELETKIRVRAEAEGLSIEAYLERLVQADQQAEDELEALALEGIDSGDPIDVGSSLIGKGDIAASLLPKGEGFQD